MSIEDATAVFKRLQIFAQPFGGKYSSVRFIAPPYADEGSVATLQCDPRTDLIPGISIASAFVKLKVTDAEFKAQYNALFG